MAVIILILVSSLIVSSLADTVILIDSTKTATVLNETGAFLNSTGYTVEEAGVLNGVFTKIELFNYTDGVLIDANRSSLSTAGVLTNATDATWANVTISYTYTYTDGSNLAGINITNLKVQFGLFVTALVAFFAILGVIIAIVWLILYLRPLFDKKTGVQSFGGS